MALAYLEGLVHADLHLSHVQNISQTQHFQHAVTMRIFVQVLLRAGFPQLSDSSAPVVDVQDNDVFVALDVDLSAVDLHSEYGG